MKSLLGRFAYLVTPSYTNAFTECRPQRQIALSHIPNSTDAALTNAFEEPVLGNLFYLFLATLETFRSFSWEPLLGNLVGTIAWARWKPLFGKCWGLLGTCAWQPLLGFTWEPSLGNLLGHVRYVRTCTARQPLLANHGNLHSVSFTRVPGGNLYLGTFALEPCEHLLGNLWGVLKTLTCKPGENQI